MTSSISPILQLIYAFSPDGNVTMSLHLMIFTGFSIHYSPFGGALIILATLLFWLVYHVGLFALKRLRKPVDHPHTLWPVCPPPFFRDTCLTALGMLPRICRLPRLLIAPYRSRTGYKSAFLCRECGYSYSLSCFFAAINAHTMTSIAPKKAPPKNAATYPIFHPPHLYPHPHQKLHSQLQKE